MRPELSAAIRHCTDLRALRHYLQQSSGKIVLFCTALRLPFALAEAPPPTVNREDCSFPLGTTASHLAEETQDGQLDAIRAR